MPAVNLNEYIKFTSVPNQLDAFRVKISNMSTFSAEGVNKNGIPSKERLDSFFSKCISSKATPPALIGFLCQIQLGTESGIHHLFVYRCLTVLSPDNNVLTLTYKLEGVLQLVKGFQFRLLQIFEDDTMTIEIVSKNNDPTPWLVHLSIKDDKLVFTGLASNATASNRTDRLKTVFSVDEALMELNHYEEEELRQLLDRTEILLAKRSLQRSFDTLAGSVVINGVEQSVDGVLNAFKEIVERVDITLDKESAIKDIERISEAVKAMVEVFKK